jgi:predicted exporter
VTRRRWPLPVASLLALALAALVFARLPVRTDLSALLPAGGGTDARRALQAVRSGGAAELVLVGIEDAPAGVLAAISRSMAATLRRDPAVALVANGDQDLGPDVLQAAFAHRYLLSPAVTPWSFGADALRADVRRVLDGLRSDAAPLVARYGLADPTGAFPALLDAWQGQARLRRVQGVWFARERDRALLLVRLRGGGLDTGAGARGLAAIRSAFATARSGLDPGQRAAAARLELAGPAVFAAEAEAAIRRDVRRLSWFAAAAIGTLLIWRFRSPLVLAAIVLPVALGAAAAAAAVWAADGAVQGVTLGFGLTMLGVAVDYPVLLIGHRKEGEAPRGTLQRIGGTFALAVATAILGLAGMAFAGVPALRQLGTFGAVGLLAAALATALLLPAAIARAGLAPVGAGDPRLLRRAEAARRFRWVGSAAALAAAASLAFAARPRFQADLASLTPVPAAALALDRALRAELGAPDAGIALLVHGPSAEAVLQREEALAPRLSALERVGAVSGPQSAAALLPSAAAQRARQASLPEAPVLAARLAEAVQGLPFAPGAFSGFLRDVSDARTQPPVTPATLGAPALAARLSPLLFPVEDGWLGVIAFARVNAAALRRMAAGDTAVTLVAFGEAAGALARDATRRALPAIGGGALASLAVMLAALRSPGLVARVAAAVAAALLVDVAVLSAAGVPLTLVHLAALQFVAGVGLDYALFFARRQVDEEERARTLRTLLTCCAMALLSFGALALCRTPLLRGIGETVAIGVVSALGFAFLWAGPMPARNA